MVVLGVLRAAPSDSQVVTSVADTVSTSSPPSQSGRGTDGGRTHTQLPGTSVRPRGPSKKHQRRHHRSHKHQSQRPHRAREQHGAAVAGEKHSITASANSASDPQVTIADFNFTPASITVHVGDTVQWVNNGPSAHTATADNGSFNTGVLQKGQSASVTFHSPGTFAYHCAIHPFMHGTVVVLANTKTSSSGSSASAGSASAGHSSSSGGAANGGTKSSGAATGASHASGGAAGSGQGTLPLTGVNVVALVVVGLVLSGGGLGLQWLRRRGLG